MKLTHLLAGVAAAAMLGGAASAQQLNVTLGAVTTTSGTSAQANANAVNNDAATSRYFVASEINTTGAAGVGTLSGSIKAPNGTAWDAQGAVRVTIATPGMVFNAPVAMSSLVCPVGGGVTIFSGGNAGDSSVTFQVADIATCITTGGDDELTFNSIAVALGAGSANVTASITRVATGLALGASRSTAGTSGDFVQRISGLRIARPALNTAQPTTTAQLPGFTALGAPVVGTPEVNIRVGLNLVGTAAGTEVTVRKDMAGNQLTNADLNGNIPVVITVPNPTGLNATTTGATLGGTQAATAAAGVLTYNVAPAAAQNAAGGQTLAFVIGSSTPTAAISAQMITAQGSAAIATAAAPTQTTAFVQPAFNLLQVLRAGSTSQAMRWVGDGVTTSAVSVFRFTNVPAPVPAVRFTISNATNGASFNGERSIPASALNSSSGGEIVLTSLNLQAIAGNFGRADVTFTFEAQNVRTERFIQAPNGTLAAAPQDAT